MTTLNNIEFKNPTGDWVNLSNLVFPVGYIVLASRSLNLPFMYGGEWSSVTNARFLSSAGSFASGGGRTLSRTPIT